MIKKYLQFINEAEQPVVDVQKFIDNQPGETMVFHLSEKLKDTLVKLMDEYKVASLLMLLKDGINKKNLVVDPVDYFDLVDDGCISFMKSKNYKGDPWDKSKRQKVKVSKVLRDIYNEKYLKSMIKETDIEAFNIKWGILMKKDEKGPHVEELRGEDILRAYGVTDKIDIGGSCANWSGKDTSIYDIYTKNPENCGTVVAVDKGIIKGRITFQQGIQFETNGKFKKGEYYTVYGNFYGRCGQYPIMLIDYLKNKYNAKHMKETEGAFIIPYETRFAHYCPFDGMYVCFEENLLSDQKVGNHWVRAYGAQCPSNLVKKRLEEEKRNPKTKKSNSEEELKDTKDPYFFTRGLSMA
jgi:hypothetical protein